MLYLLYLFIRVSSNKQLFFLKSLLTSSFHYIYIDLDYKFVIYDLR
jgi:hypothetical protein